MRGRTPLFLEESELWRRLMDSEAEGREGRSKVVFISVREQCVRPSNKVLGTGQLLGNCKRIHQVIDFGGL